MWYSYLQYDVLVKITFKKCLKLLLRHRSREVISLEIVASILLQEISLFSCLHTFCNHSHPQSVCQFYDWNNNIIILAHITFFYQRAAKSFITFSYFSHKFCINFKYFSRKSSVLPNWVKVLSPNCFTGIIPISELVTKHSS